MRNTPKPQEIYKHFKGNLYQIITIAEHSETGESMVIYQALYGTYKIYARPIDSFMDRVDRVKYPHAQQEYRFECINPENSTLTKENSTSADENGTSADECSASAQQALDPLVWDFLDADSHEARLNILAALHHRITDEMITTMAIACDVEVPEGDLEERYSQLKNCLLMLDKFEIRRV